MSDGAAEDVRLAREACSFTAKQEGNSLPEGVSFGGVQQVDAFPEPHCKRADVPCLGR
jgi:hypothetical protein